MDIKTLARECGATVTDSEIVFDIEEAYTFARLIAEECAKICEHKRADNDMNDAALFPLGIMYRIALSDSARAIRDMFKVVTHDGI